MNEELNKKLADWAGFTEVVAKGTLTIKVWKDPQGREDMCNPNFTESLDACFKWLVLKLICTANYSIIITQNLGQCIGYVRPLQGGKQYDAVDNHNPALALCLAIEKLIDGGN